MGNLRYIEAKDEDDVDRLAGRKITYDDGHSSPNTGQREFRSEAGLKRSAAAWAGKFPHQPLVLIYHNHGGNWYGYLLVEERQL